ncbi:hypothetical protein EAH80_03355 [Mycobacterium hodleri]|uniref:Uncharacterized protein n=2 Tax=Mycolicibacterium hodleri TaxID=49897 RepID=A0A502EHI4_9MYCO|nr:hypothetical protein EAH80_03355 [Mycolicibacterium hodleri]
MSYWFVGAVVASLIPFLPDIVHWVDGKANTPDFYDSLARGELLAIAMVVTIGGLAELAPVRHDIRYSAGWVVGGVLIGLSEGIWYTDVVTDLMDGHAMPPDRLAWGSIALFVISAVISLRSIYLVASSR